MADEEITFEEWVQELRELTAKRLTHEPRFTTDQGWYTARELAPLIEQGEYSARRLIKFLVKDGVLEYRNDGIRLKDNGSPYRARVYRYVPAHRRNQDDSHESDPRQTS